MDYQTQELQATDYTDIIFDTFMELCGDRRSGDDTAVIGGLARLSGYKVVAVVYQRDLSVDPPKIPGPEGYRKCSRLIQLAEAFNKPVILLFGIATVPLLSASEQQRINEAIAHNLEEMSSLMTPIIGVIMNENSAPTAINMCVADRVIMFQDTSYSNLLTDKALESGVDTAVSCLKAQDLLDLNIVHKVVKGAWEGDLGAAASSLREAILEELLQLRQIRPETLVQQRLRRFQYQFLHIEASRLPSGNLNSTI